MQQQQMQMQQMQHQQYFMQQQFAPPPPPQAPYQYQTPAPPPSRPQQHAAPQQQHQQQQQQHSGKRPRTEAAADPLDPSAKGYTARFGAAVREEEEEVAAPEPAPGLYPRQYELAPGMTAGAAHPAAQQSPPVDVPVTVVSSEELMRQRYQIPEEPQQGPESGPAEQPHFQAPSAEELMRRRFLVPAVPAEQEAAPAGPTMLSAEELMRRRFLVPAVDDSALQDDAGPSVGPYRPPPGDEEGMSYYATYGGYGDEEQEEQEDGDSDSDDQSVEDVPFSEEEGRSSSSSLAQTAGNAQGSYSSTFPAFKTPVLNLRMASSSAASAGGGLLGLLGQYGDDEDEEEESEREDEQHGAQEEAAATSAMIAAAIGASFGAKNIFASLPPGPTLPQIPRASEYKSDSSSAVAAPVAGSHKPDAFVASAGLPMPASQSAASATASRGLVKGPRIVQTDAAVTRLVPNVLRMKKQQQQQQAQPRVFPGPAAKAAAAAPAPRPAPSAEEDDAYSAFLSEISGLGGEA